MGIKERLNLLYRRLETLTVVSRAAPVETGVG